MYTCVRSWCAQDWLTVFNFLLFQNAAGRCRDISLHSPSLQTVYTHGCSWLYKSKAKHAHVATRPLLLQYFTLPPSIMATLYTQQFFLAKCHAPLETSLLLPQNPNFESIMIIRFFPFILFLLVLNPQIIAPFFFFFFFIPPSRASSRKSSQLNISLPLSHWTDNNPKEKERKSTITKTKTKTANREKKSQRKKSPI